MSKVITMLLVVIVIGIGLSGCVTSSAASLADGAILNDANPDTHWEVYYTLGGKMNIIRTDRVVVVEGFMKVSQDYWEFTGDTQRIQWKLHKVTNYNGQFYVLPSKAVNLRY